MSSEGWKFLRDSLYNLVYLVETDKDAEIVNKEVSRILSEFQDLEGV